MPEIAKYVFDYYLQRVQELKQVHQVCTYCIIVLKHPYIIPILLIVTDNVLLLCTIGN